MAHGKTDRRIRSVISKRAVAEFGVLRTQRLASRMARTGAALISVHYGRVSVWLVTRMATLRRLRCIGPSVCDHGDWMAAGRSVEELIARSRLCQ